MNIYCYNTKDKINNMGYIGARSCSCAIEDDPYLGSGSVFKLALEKYGENNFEKEILAVCETIEEAYEKEKELIEKYDAVNSKKYYNIAPGGKRREKGFTMSQKELEKKQYLEEKIKNDPIYCVRVNEREEEKKTPQIIIGKIVDLGHRQEGYFTTINCNKNQKSSDPWSLGSNYYNSSVTIIYSNPIDWAHEKGHMLISEEQYNRYICELLDSRKFFSYVDKIRLENKQYFANKKKREEIKNNRVINMNKVVPETSSYLQKTSMDYIEEYAKKSKDYKNFLSLYKKYSTLGFATIYYSITGQGSITAKCISDGNLKCSDSQAKIASKILDAELQFVDVAKRVGGRKDYFYMAIAFCFACGVDAKMLYRKLKTTKSGKNMKPIKSIDDAVKQIDRVYNYGLNEEKKIPIKEMYGVSVKSRKKK